MSTKLKALITGISGQDGSYLAKLLLEKGYEVYGAERRSASSEHWRLKKLGIIDQVKMVPFELLEHSNIVETLEKVRPDEIYNLGAMSFVGASFKQPVYTCDVNGLGVVRLLEAVRKTCPKAKIYQASTSEMFGSSFFCFDKKEKYQNEETPFHPRSPYGCSKLLAHSMVVNYREAYGMFACSGILFNHECVPSGTPVAVRKDGIVDIVDIDEIVPHRTNPKSGKRYTSNGGGYEIWDGENWVTCNARTATWHDEEIVTIHSRGGIVEATSDHVIFTKEGEKPSGEVKEGDQLFLTNPKTDSFGCLTKEEAWLIGILVADGHIGAEGRHARVTNNNNEILKKVESLWASIAMGSSRLSKTSSGFGDSLVGTINLSGNSSYLSMLRGEIYCENKGKKIPKRILNASEEIKIEFLRGYNDGDGLKSGHRTDEFKSFRTTSSVLAAGLVWLSRTVLRREVSVYLQPGTASGENSYLINPSSENKQGEKGAHLRKDKNEVRKVERRKYQGWMFDLATETKKFSAGVGFITVHNSPLRGEEFVTRKITKGMAEIYKKLAPEKAENVVPIQLGNLNAKRDWGHAEDYVYGMWQMLQQEKPDDYVLATGETKSVRDFINAAAEVLGWCISWDGEGLEEKAYIDRGGKKVLVVEVNEEFYRPSDVEHLCGLPTKAKEKLNWEPKYSFEKLVESMVFHDLGFDI